MRAHSFCFVNPRSQILYSPSEAHNLLGLGGLRDREINMIVVSTSGIESLPARRAAAFAAHVLVDGQFSAAGATKNDSPAPFHLRPDLDRMIGQGVVTILAGIVNPTALHLDRDNVCGSVIVLATSLRIKTDATNFWKSSHNRISENESLTRWSAVLRRIRQSPECDPQSESPISSAACGPRHPAPSSGSRSWDERKG